jgi:2-polyprenyl-3-methyl-5-hydroxy-6-metoxy-1,4-benzoquinol methylase
MQDNNPEQEILEVWRENAGAWTRAVRDGRIRSRETLTNDAIIRAVLEGRPTSVLDLGCGEGWLARQLAARGIRVIGLDAIEALVTAARQAGGGEFHVLSYQQLARQGWPESVDRVVCNFSLLGDDSVHQVLAAAPGLLNAGGELLIQTLSPRTVEQAGWRDGSWAGCGEDFSRAAPWYARRLDDWLGLFRQHRLTRVETLEPRHRPGDPPASIIFRLHPL